MKITKTSIFWSMIRNVLLKCSLIYFLVYFILSFALREGEYHAIKIYMLGIVSIIYVFIFAFICKKAFHVYTSIGNQEKMAGRNFKIDMKGTILEMDKKMCSNEHWFVLWEKFYFYAFCKDNITDVGPIMPKGKKYYSKVETKDNKQRFVLVENRVDDLRQLQDWYGNI